MDMCTLVLNIYKMKNDVSFQIFMTMWVHYKAHCNVTRLQIGLVTQAIALTLESRVGWDWIILALGVQYWLLILGVYEWKNIVALVRLRWDSRKLNMKWVFILKPYSRILSVVINIVYVNLLTQVGFLSKSQTYDSHGTEEWHAQLGWGYGMTHPHTVCAKCRLMWWVTSEFRDLVTMWPSLGILLHLEL